MEWTWNEYGIHMDMGWMWTISGWNYGCSALDIWDTTLTAVGGLLTLAGCQGQL